MFYLSFTPFHWHMSHSHLCKWYSLLFYKYISISSLFFFLLSIGHFRFVVTNRMSVAGSSILFPLTGNELAGIGGSSPLSRRMGCSQPPFLKSLCRCYQHGPATPLNNQHVLTAWFGPVLLHARQLSQSSQKRVVCSPHAQPTIHLATLPPKNFSPRDAVIKGNCVSNFLL